jgi:hypothetical protein
MFRWSLRAAPASRQVPGESARRFVDSLRSLVNGKSVAVYNVEYPASYDFLRAIDGVNDAGIFIRTWLHHVHEPKWCWEAIRRVPPSLTSSLQQAGRFSGLQVRCPILSLITSRQWRYSATHRTAWESH